MNILILTPTDPTSIMLCGQDLFSGYSENNTLFSIQMMALLGEKVTEQNYIVNNNYFAAEMRDNPRVCIAKNTHYDNLIMFGNCDNKAIKFDHIITWDTIWRDIEDEDPYLTKQEQEFEQTFKNLNIKPIRWYKRGDVEYSFPDWSHLCLFLKTLGVRTNGIQ